MTLGQLLVVEIVLGALAWLVNRYGAAVIAEPFRKLIVAILVVVGVLAAIAWLFPGAFAGVWGMTGPFG